MNEQNSFSPSETTAPANFVDENENNKLLWQAMLRKTRQQREQQTVLPLNEEPEKTILPSIQTPLTEATESPVVATVSSQDLVANGDEVSVMAQPEKQLETQPEKPSEKPFEKQPETQTQPEKPANNEDLDWAYRAFCAQKIAKHNASVSLHQNEENTDSLLLIEEDWLARQPLLSNEVKYKQTTLNEQVVLEANEHAPSFSGSLKTDKLPEYVVNVYDLPKLPPSQSVQLISEQELLKRLNERLMRHFNDVLPMMVCRVMQKQMLSFQQDLQTILKEETSKLVEDILSAQLSQALKHFKYQIRHE